MAAGPLNTPIKVQRRASASSNKYGSGVAGALADVPGLGDIWARVTPKQGGEVSLAARLEGRQAWELLVRRDEGTATITAADHIVTLDDLALELDVSSAAIYQADPEYILITGETGSASG